MLSSLIPLTKADMSLAWAGSTATRTMGVARKFMERKAGQERVVERVADLSTHWSRPAMPTMLPAGTQSTGST